MCGIFGYFDYLHGNRNIDQSLFDKAVDSLRHRGPDSWGTILDKGIGFGHRRLSIIDLSDLGKQPMISPGKKVWITYNGEIYNFPELKQLLIKKNYRFRSTSDTEVLLYAYLEWGRKCIEYIRGIFAFAVWDSTSRELWLVRDHIGVKPLFYTDYEGIIYFSSEIHSLLNLPFFPNDPDYTGLDSFFTFGYVPAPQTGYKHVKQLLPGHSLLVKIGGKPHSYEYWDLPLGQDKKNNAEKNLIIEMEELFNKVVRDQMISDAPLGIFLSSGTDSFAVAMSAKKSDKKDINAYSIGFNNKKFDELEQTRLAARALNVNLVSKRINENINVDTLNKIAWHSQEPFADSSSIPMYFLCEMTSENVKVALSGDGADELFGGYSLYNANKYADLFRKIPDFIKNDFIKPVSKWVPDVGGKYTYKEKVRRFIYGAERGKFMDHASWRVILTDEVKRKVYSREFYDEVKDHDPLEPYVRHILKAKEANCSDLDACLYADLKFYLPNDMLVKVDRMSMAHGLEVRVPFLDLEMVNFCWSLPANLKVKNGKLKYILKKLISNEYPRELQRRPKSGFNIYLDNLETGNKIKDSNLFSNYHKFLLQYLRFIFKSTSLNSNVKKSIVNV